MGTRSLTILLILLVAALSSCVYNDIPRVPPCDVEATGATFSSGVLPIVRTNCAVSGCHDGSVFPKLTTYAEINANAALIRPQVVSRRMPLDRTLGQDQIDLIVCWIDNGSPED